LFVRPSAPRPVSLRLCQRMALMGPDSPIAGRVGEKHFCPEQVLFYSMAPGPPRPRPRLLFARAKSNQKHASGSDTFDGVPPLCTPPPRRHKGGSPPLESPA